jgi:DNA-binding HxlR family transcriptional regulator
MPTKRAKPAAHPAPPELERTPTNCVAREMLVRVADKWSMYVIHVLANAGPLRFSELRRRVDGVSQRMLTVTLRGLERDGLVRRMMYPEVPPRVEYALTPLGATLREIVGRAAALGGGRRLSRRRGDGGSAIHGRPHARRRSLNESCTC